MVDSLEELVGDKKRWALILLAVAVLAIILLSAGLSDVKFRPGQPFSLGKLGPSAGGQENRSSGGTIFYVIWRVLAFVFLLLLPFSIGYFIISPEARREVLRNLLAMLSFLALYYLFYRAVREGTFNVEGLLEPQPASEQTVVPSISPSEFSAPSPAWVTFAVSVGFAALLVGVFLGIFWYVRRHTLRPTQMEELAERARDALDEIRAGGDFKNTVIRCYAEMSRVLGERRGLVRRKGMTPREFENRLGEAGLPQEDVRRLTRLFEDVRYGAKDPDASREREAEACLAAIVHASERIS